MEYNANNPFDAPDANTAAKIEELRRKEEELNKRERILDQRSQILVEREKTVGKIKKKNWPKCYPLVYHNIDEDMSTPDLKRLAKIGYSGWMLSVAALIINIVTLCAVMIATGDGQAIGSFILSIIYFILLAPLWFLLYIKFLYRAASNGKPILYIVFLIFFSIEIIAFIGFAVGVPGTGSGGFFLMTNTFKDDHKAAGFVVLGGSIVWCICCAYGVLLFILTRLEYRNAGGLKKAKQEMGEIAIDQAKKNPELLAKGAKYAADQAIKNPDLVVKAANAV